MNYNYTLLKNINENFDKLFSGCKNGVLFTPPLFDCSSDIESLIVLNQIIDIILQTNGHRLTQLEDPNSKKLTKLLSDTLNQIITIKCKEFIMKYPWDNNLDSFLTSFYEYINNTLNNL
jgi:hypothetical protein